MYLLGIPPPISDCIKLNNIFLLSFEEAAANSRLPIIVLCLQDQPCRYNSSGMAAQIKGYKEVPKGNERALAVALFKVGPVSVGIDATQPTFQFYQRGQLQLR